MTFEAWVILVCGLIIIACLTVGALKQWVWYDEYREQSELGRNAD